MPAKDIYVALLIVSCLQQNASIGRTADSIFGINWVHLSLGMVSPYSSSIVMNLLENGKRLLEKAKTKKKPITPDNLAALVNKFGMLKPPQRVYVYCIYALLVMQAFFGSTNSVI